MPDYLKFGVGFDVETGVKEAQVELEKAVEKLGRGWSIPLDINPSFAGIEKLRAAIIDLNKIKLNPVSEETKASIDALVANLNKLGKALERINELNEQQLRDVSAVDNALTKALINEQKLAQAKNKTAESQAKVNKANADAARSMAAAEQAAVRLEKAQSNTTAQRLADQYKEAETAIRAITEEVERVSFLTHIGNLDFFTRSYGDKGAIDEITNSLEDLARSEQKLSEQHRAGIVSQDEYADATNRINEAREKANALSDAIANSMVNEDISEPLTIDNDVIDNLEKAAEVVEDLSEATKSFDGQPASAWADEIRDAAARVAEGRDDIAEYMRVIKELREEYQNGEITYSDYIEAQTEYTASLAEARYELRENNKELTNLLALHDQDNATIRESVETYDQLISRISLLQQELRGVTIASPEFNKLNSELQELQRNKESYQRLTSDLARSSRTWGREVVDLTYAVRLFDPSLGIIVQRFQRISALGQIWNKSLLQLQSSLKVTRGVAISIGTGAVAVLVAGAFRAVKAFQEWRKEIKETEERLSKTADEFRSFARSITDAMEGVNNVLSEGDVSFGTSDALRAASDELEKILTQNKALAPIVKERLRNVTDEVERLTALRNIYQNITDIVGNTRYANIIEEGLDVKLRKFQKNANNAAGAANKLTSALLQIGPQGEAIAAEFDKLINSGVSLGDAYAYVREQIESIAEPIALRTEFGILETYGQYDKVLTIIRDATDYTESFGRSVESVVGNITNLYKQTPDGAIIPWGESLKEAEPAVRDYARLSIATWFEVWEKEAGKNLTPFAANLFRTQIEDSLGVALDSQVESLRGWRRQLEITGAYTREQALEFTNSAAAAQDLSTRISDVNDQIKINRALLATGSKDEAYRAEISENINSLEALRNALLEAQKYFGIVPAKDRRQSDTRQQELLAEIGVVEQAINRYRELSQYLPGVESRAQVLSSFASSFREFKFLDGFHLEFDNEDVERAILQALRIGGKTGQNFLNSKGVLDLNLRLSKNELDGVKRQLEIGVREVQQSLSAQKEANRFFEDIFAARGDVDLAANLTLKLTGRSVQNVRQELSRNINEMLMRYAFNGNVNLLSRPTIDAIELVKAGWEDADIAAGEYIATLNSVQHSVIDGMGTEVELLLTPILPDGKVLSPKELADYIDGTLARASDILGADELGIVIAIDVDGAGQAGELLHQLQEAYYSTDQALSIALINEVLSLDGIPEKQRENLNTLLSELRSYDMDVVRDLYKTLGKFEDYETRRSIITRQGEEERARIREQFAGVEAESLIDASVKAQEQALASLNFNELKEGGLWQSVFDDIENVGTRTLDILTEKVRGFIDSIGADLPINEYKELVTQFNKLEAAKFDRNPFRAAREGLAEYVQAVRELRQAETEYLAESARLTANIESYRDQLTSTTLTEEERAEIQAALVRSVRALAEAEERLAVASNNVSRAGNKTRNAIAKLAGDISDVVNAASTAANSFVDMGKALGFISQNADISALTQTLGGVETSALGVAKIFDGLASSNPAVVVAGAIGAIGGLFSTIGGIFTALDKRTRRANREIERQADIIKNLERAYRSLERAMSKALGTDAITTSRKQVENLEAQILAVQAQITAEQSKKKKKQDNSQIEAWYDEIDNIRETILDLQETIESELLGGTDLSSLAKNFADSWTEAFFSLENTFDAIKGSFRDLVRDMLRNAIANQIVGTILEGYFKDISKLVDEQGNINEQLLNYYLQTWESKAREIDDLLTEAFGKFDLGSLFDSGEDTLTSISKAIRSLTEDTALVLAAKINSIEYWVVANYENSLQQTELLRALLGEGDGVSLFSIQQETLTELQLIRANTGQLVDLLRDVSTLLSNVTNVTATGVAFRSFLVD